MELSSPKLKKFFIFQEELLKSENKKLDIFCLLRENSPNISAKGKSFLYFPL